MTILKRKKYITLSIEKSGGWYNDSGTEILAPTKIALERQPKNCGKKCIFASICSFWAPKYRLHGINREVRSGNKYGLRQECRCDTEYYTISPFSSELITFDYLYVFTYESIKGKISYATLRDMGLIPDPPKKTGKQLNLSDRPSKYSNPRTTGRTNTVTTGRTNTVPRRNYNARRR